MSTIFPNTTGGAGGGAIGNVFGMLTVTGSRFSHNQAIGGNDNQGGAFVGHGFGGGIASGGPGSVTLTVGGSTFDHNQAIGGNNNQSTIPSGTFGPGKADGGGITVFQGAGTISDSTLDHNVAMGGQGVAGGTGGLGAGGGIVIASFYQPVSASVRDCAIIDNSAIGGQAGAGGNGGDAWGGGIAVTAGASLTVIGSIIDHNQAQGGAADTSGLSSQGGNGLGGGLYNGTGSTLTISASTITDNEAHASQGHNGGSDGTGVGGGIYSLGSLSYLDTIIEHNHADTSNDDLFPGP